MKRKILIGAPSLVGKEAFDLVKKGFADASYPIKVAITNHMPRDVALPEVKGLYLRSVYYPEGSSATVVITDEAQIKRLISGVEQISELNVYHKAVTIEEVAPVLPAEKEPESNQVTNVSASDSEQPRGNDPASNSSPDNPDLAQNGNNGNGGNNGQKAKPTHKRGK